MAIAQFELKGHVTRSDTQHGVRVEAWDVKHASESPLGVALTNRDGSYQIDLRGDSAETVCCECPEVYLKLRDRDCRLIYDGAPKDDDLGSGMTIDFSAMCWR